jgi:hypothetical protein
VTVWNALVKIAPASGQFHGGLSALYAGVHGKHPVVSEIAGYVETILSQGIGMKSSRGESKPGGLLGHGLDQTRMAMSLVDRRIGGQTVDEPVALGIPKIDPFCAG